MAVASTITQLPLDRFAAVAGIHPLHFNGVDVSDIAPASTCDDPYLQYSWQDAARIGREEIAQTIADVEQRLMDFLNFALRPTFYRNVDVMYPRPSNPELLSTSLFDARGLVREVKLPAGYMIGGGVETKTFIGAGATVVYSDSDGDGYAETATITITVDPAVVRPGEVAIYYPNQGGQDIWEIRPTTVTIDTSSGVTTIVCRREQLVLWDLLSGLAAKAVDGLENSSFLTTVDVYQHWLDYSQPHVQFRWEQTPWLPGNAAVQFATQNGAMLVTNSLLGWVAVEPAHWNAPSGTFVMDTLQSPRMPDTLRAWFKAGYPLDARGNMDSTWERCVTYLTLASLNRPLCACDALRTFTDYWAYDPAENTPEKTHQISRLRLDNPLGTTRAAQYAWSQITRLRLPDV